jgi:hypothetical protein
VQVNADAPPISVQLCFHVLLGPVQIAFIPLGVALSAGAGAAQRHSSGRVGPAQAIDLMMEHEIKSVL